MTIHPVIFITQLEPAFDTPDFYWRVNDRESPPIRTENDENPEYEIERLTDKRIFKPRFYYYVK